MINLEYFKNLVSSKKYLLLFIFLISLLSAFVEDGVYLIFSITLLLCFILPIIVFKYIHDKKAVDTYFSLPLSRKELLITGLFFCAIAVIAPCGISYLIYDFVYNDLTITSAIGLIGIMSICIIALAIFNTLLYQLANTEFDGIVMIGAYSLLPVALIIVLDIFSEVFVSGYISTDFELIGYLSPVYLMISLFTNNYSIKHLELSLYDYKCLFAVVIFAAISFAILYYFFPKRKVEIAGTSSSKFFAYPFVIYTYTLLVLFGISSNYSYSYGGIFDFLEEFFVLYLITFALFVIAHFVYKRKFYFNIKLPIFFIIALSLSLIFCTTARSTNGFGLAYKYPKDDKNVKYELYTSMFSNNIYEWFNDKTGVDSGFIDISITTINNDGKLNKEVIDKLEEFRLEAINQFYEPKNNNEDSNESYISLYVYNGYKVKDNKEDYEEKHYYHLLKEIELSTLFSLADYDDVEIIITCEYGDYKLSKNGELLLINRYNVYEGIQEEVYYE